MSFEEFENMARLYVVGALEGGELREFQQAREKFGRVAEETVNECRKLNAAFALSLHPREPHPATKEKLLTRIYESIVEEAFQADDAVE